MTSLQRHTGVGGAGGGQNGAWRLLVKFLTGKSQLPALHLCGAPTQGGGSCSSWRELRP